MAIRNRKTRFITAILLLSIVVVIAPGSSLAVLPPDAKVQIDSASITGMVPEAGKSLPSLRGLAFSPDGKLLATRGEPSDPSKPRVVHIWEAATGKLSRVLELHDIPLTSIAFSPDGRYLATGQPDHPAGTQIWDVKTGRLVSRMDGGRGRVQFLPGGQQVAIVAAFGPNDIVRIHDVGTGRESRRIIAETNYRFAFSPDGSRLLSLRTEGRTDLYLTDLAGKDEAKKLLGCKSTPTAFAFSADGRTIAAATSDRIARDRYEYTVILWEATTLAVVNQLKLHTKRVFAAEFSPDGRYLATAGGDRSVKLWELATGKLVHSFVGHRGPVAALAFSPDSTRLASGGFDKTVLIWDVAARSKSFLPKGPVDEAALQLVWRDLASASPANAYQAIGRMAASEERTLVALRNRVHGILVPSQNQRVQQLLAELDDDDSVVRNRATRELRKLRQVARPVLLKVFEETTSVEVRYRLRRILGGKKDEERFSKSDVRRMRRIIHLAEMTGGKQAEEILEMIIKGFPVPEAVRDAKETLERLRQRSR